jgi:hypothetical protein
VNFTYVPDSRSHSLPRSIASFMPALYSAGELPTFNRNGPLNLLDMDTAVPHRLHRIDDLHQLVRSGVEISELVLLDEFHRCS